MKRVIVWGGGIVLVGVIALGVLAAVIPFPSAPASLHGWWPVPIACAGPRCVTYRELSRVVRAAGSQATPEELLSILLSRQVLRQVARRTGISVASVDVDTALAVIRATTNEARGLREFLDLTYAGGIESPELRRGLEDLLLGGKLQAAGFGNVWLLPEAPRIRVFHIGYRFEKKTHMIVRR